LFTTLSSITIPTGYLQAVKEKCWQQAMHEELYALKANMTWEGVDCLAGM
jgi:hypothetical protein